MTFLIYDFIFFNKFYNTKNVTFPSFFITFHSVLWKQEVIIELNIALQCWALNKINL